MLKKKNAENGIQSNQRRNESFCFTLPFLIEFGQHFESNAKLWQRSAIRIVGKKTMNANCASYLSITQFHAGNNRTNACILTHSLAPSVTQSQLRARSPVNLVHSRHVLIVAKWCAVRGDLTRGHSLLRLVNCRAPYKMN